MSQRRRLGHGLGGLGTGTGHGHRARGSPIETHLGGFQRSSALSSRKLLEHCDPEEQSI